jgi:hypothetical protein
MPSLAKVTASAPPVSWNTTGPADAGGTVSTINGRAVGAVAGAVVGCVVGAAALSGEEADDGGSDVADDGVDAVTTVGSVDDGDVLAGARLVAGESSIGVEEPADPPAPSTKATACQATPPAMIVASSHPRASITLERTPTVKHRPLLATPRES